MKLAAIYARLDDAANPIAVKELRQAVRSKLIASMIVLFLLIEFSVIGIMIAFESPYSGYNYSMGSSAFATLFTILQIACIIFVPMYTGSRMMFERVGVDIDLTYITTLSPWSVVAGKFLSGLVLIIVIYSACVPFLTFTYFLRGIDLPTIAVMLGVGLVIGAVALMFSVLVGSIPASRPMRGLLALFQLSVLVSIVSWMMAIYADFQYGFSGSSYGNGFIYWVLGICAALIAVLYILSTALIAPPSSNRSFPVRLMMTALWLVTGAAAFIYYFIAKARGGAEPFVIEAWVYVFTACFCLAFLGAISERSGFPPRIRRLIPRKALLRKLSFLFFSGPVGGMLWAASSIVATIVAFYIFASIHDPAALAYSFDIPIEQVSVLASAALFLIAYSLTGVYIRRRFLSRFVPEDYTWVIALIALAIGSVVPSLIGVIWSTAYLDVYSSPYTREPTSWFITNPFALSSYRELAVSSVILSSLYAALMYFLNLPWLRAQAALFKPMEKVEALPEDEQ